MLRTTALALILLADLAMAAEPATPLPVGPAFTAGTFETDSDIDRWTANVTVNLDYAATIDTLDNANGEARLSAGGREVFATPDRSAGFELRGPGGPVVLEAQDIGHTSLPHRYRVRVMTDCRADPSTKCRIKPGVSQTRRFAFPGDADWHRLTLPSGSYTIEISIPALLRVVDGKGREVAKGEGTELKFTVTAKMRHFLVFQGIEDGEQQYVVGLRRG